MLLAQTRAELLMRWRVPAFSLTSLALPVVFFTFFGLPGGGLTRPDGISVGAFLVASFGAYAVGSVMVYSFGIGVAVERGMKVDLLMRVTPVPAGVYLLAKVITALVFSLVSLVVLIAYGVVVGGVTQPLAVWGEMIVRLLAGSVPFIGLGLCHRLHGGSPLGPGRGEPRLSPAGLRLRPLRAAEPAPALRAELRARTCRPITTASSCGARSAPAPSRWR